MNDYEKLTQALQYLASVCNYASTEDGHGFNKLDAKFGHSLANQSLERQLTPNQQTAAIKLLKTYRNQLELAGFELPLNYQVQNSAKPVSCRQIDSNGKQFIITFDYDSKLVNAVKALPNRKPKKVGKDWFWYVPLIETTAIQNFANEHNFELTLTALEAINYLAEKKEENLQASIAYHADIEVEGLNGTLRPFQKAGVAYAVANKQVFIADEMGLGKTVQAIATVHKLNAYPALVICPASLKLNWQREINKWLPGKTVEIINGKEGEFISDFTIINYDILGKHKTALLNRKHKIVIADESHYLKNYKAARTEHAKNIFNQAEYRILLTGTPVLNRPQELLSQLGILGRLDDLGGFWNFARKYCNAHQTRWGWDFSGANNLDELNTKLRQTCFVRRTKAEVLKELPAKQRTSLYLPLSNRKEYNNAERDLIAYLKAEVKQDKAFYASINKLSDEEKKQAIVQRQNDVAQKAKRAEHLVKINALKQLTAKGKLNSVFEWIESFIETDEQLVVFAHHTEIVKQIADKFNAPSITGSTTIENRQKAVDCFQAGDCQLIVGNIKAMGVGLTLTAASNVAFVELAWTPSDHDQAEDRIHRIGQESNSVNAWYLLAENTIDEQIARLIDKKRQVVSAVTDGNDADNDNGILSALTDWLVSR